MATRASLPDRHQGHLNVYSHFFKARDTRKMADVVSAVFDGVETPEAAPLAIAEEEGTQAATRSLTDALPFAPVRRRVEMHSFHYSCGRA
jgi:hypothetical protein